MVAKLHFSLFTPNLKKRTPKWSKCDWLIDIFVWYLLGKSRAFCHVPCGCRVYPDQEWSFSLIAFRLYWCTEQCISRKGNLSYLVNSVMVCTNNKPTESFNSCRCPCMQVSLYAGCANRRLSACTRVPYRDGSFIRDATLNKAVIWNWQGCCERQSFFLNGESNWEPFRAPVCYPPSCRYEQIY